MGAGAEATRCCCRVSLLAALEEELVKRVVPSLRVPLPRPQQSEMYTRCILLCCRHVSYGRNQVMAMSGVRKQGGVSKTDRSYLTPPHHPHLAPFLLPFNSGRFCGHLNRPIAARSCSPFGRKRRCFGCSRARRTTSSTSPSSSTSGSGGSSTRSPAASSTSSEEHGMAWHACCWCMPHCRFCFGFMHGQGTHCKTKRMSSQWPCISFCTYMPGAAPYCGRTASVCDGGLCRRPLRKGNDLPCLSRTLLSPPRSFSRKLLKPLPPPPRLIFSENDRY